MDILCTRMDLHQGKDGQITDNRYLPYNRGRWAENRLDKERSLPWEKGLTNSM
jgi:hypothetical protein